MRRTVFFVLVMAAGALRGAETPDKIMKRVENAIKDAKTMRIAFVETFVWTLTGDSQSLEGQMVLGEGDRFYIDTPEQVIVSDGKTLWTYSKEAKRVLIDLATQSSDAILPRQILFEYREKYRARIAGNEAAGGRMCIVLDFTSNDEEQYYSRVKVWVDQEAWVPHRVEQTDLNGDITRYELKTVELGVPVEETLFTFTPPRGSEVIDMR